MLNRNGEPIILPEIAKLKFRGKQVSFEGLPFVLLLRSDSALAKKLFCIGNKGFYFPLSNTGCLSPIGK